MKIYPELKKCCTLIRRESHPLPLGEEEVIAYDLTAVPIFGDTCPLAANGYNASHSQDKQIKMGGFNLKIRQIANFTPDLPGKFQ